MKERTKQCSKCKRILPVSEFYPDKKKKYGVSTHCKECHKEYSKKDTAVRARKEYYDKNFNVFGRSGKRRGCRGITKRDYELTEEQLRRRNRKRENNKKGVKVIAKCPCHGLLIWYDGALDDLTSDEYLKVMRREYNRQRNCAIRGYVGRVKPSEHFLFDFDLEKMFDDNVCIDRGYSRLYITKWWEGEIRHWTVNDGVWRK